MDDGSPLRIVIATRIFSPEPSAASFMLEAIAKGFRDAGHHVTVLTTRSPAHDATATNEALHGITVRRAPVLRDRSGYVRGYLPYLSFDIPLFFRLLFSRRADLYLVEPPPTTGAVVRVATWLRRRPYVYDAADIWSDAAQLVTSSRVVLGLLRAVEVFALRGASRAFAISDGLIARLRELDVQVPATAIGFGVDTDAFSMDPAVTEVEPADPYFIYAGTYSEWHGAGIFLDAFAEFSRTHPRHRLIFIGNGSERPLLTERARALGLDRVEFRDPVDSTTLNPLLGAATASLASLKPGMGYDYAFTTKVYSSVASGCPTIFTGTGPTVEFLDSAAKTVSIGVAVPYSVEAVAQALHDAAEHPASIEERRALSSWAHDRFSLAAIAARVVDESVEMMADRL